MPVRAGKQGQYGGMKDIIEKLEMRRQGAKQGGGQKRIEAQHKRKAS